ncbi:MAG: hypothetical protein JXQ90_07050 [Cyclobacteriaceae bacterium]
MSVIAQEKIEKASQHAKDKLVALGIEDQLIAEIEWCLGSYAADHNPEGLVEKTGAALDALKEYKKSHPRKVAKKLIDELEKAVSSN